MSKFKRVLAFICALSLLTGILAGCQEEVPSGSSDPSSQPTGSTGSGGDPVIPGQKTDYQIQLHSVGGLPLANVDLFVYSDDTLSDMEGFGRTDEEGKATISLTASASYHLVVSNPPAGYNVEKSYPMTTSTMDIALTSQPIADQDISGVSYKLGDVMHDFTITDVDGKTYVLSDLLKEKDMVMLNFWYVDCTYCVQEFPYMDRAYQNYLEDVAIIGLNINDTAKEAKDFRDGFYDVYDANPDTTGALGIPMAIDEAGFGVAFNLQAAPTSVIIDRYGVITMIHAGALVSEDYFYYIFDAMTGDDYQQKLYPSFDDIVPEKKPTESMPSSDEIAGVLNGSEMNVTYSPETDPDSAESSWPFIIGNKDGADCVYPSNAGVEGTFAIMYANVTMKAGQALGIDYYSSSEAGGDILYVLVNRNDVYHISGPIDEWRTCYPWVATEDGEYEIAFCYLKDISINQGDDTVYLTNMRLVDVNEIDVPSYIPRFAATHLKADGFGYENYITPVFNEADGYYHVNSADGPLLMANLMMSTQFSNNTVYALIQQFFNDNPEASADVLALYDRLVRYCSYASNSMIYSLCPVTEELKQLLQMIAAEYGIEQTENEWLQICEYYNAYGTNGVELEDPTKGLSAHSAFEAKLGKNSVTYNRIIMPRGLFHKFVPSKSGVYRITSHSPNSPEWIVDGWIFTAENMENPDVSPMYEYWFNERAWTDSVNVSMVVYLEAGKEYYINLAYYNIEQYGTIDFTIEYVGAQLDHLILASPGVFTYVDENTYDLVAGGIDVALGSDGYYHELLPNGDLGSILYLDMIAYSTIFPEQTMFELIQSGAFNFAITEDDQWIIDYYNYFKNLNFNGKDFESCMREVWGEEFEAYWKEFEVENVLEGIYHGTGKDYTDIMRKYANKVYKSGDLEGCVAVTEELAEILQLLMDKYTFKNVDHSWTKLCYYYDYLGPDPNK